MSPGRTSSLRLPTAEKATMALTPRCFRAAMLARAGTLEGGIEWLRPWRARNASVTLPVGVSSEAMVMGEDGTPHGVTGLTVRSTLRLSSL